MIFNDIQATLASHPLRRLHTLSRVVLIAALCFLSYLFDGWPALLVLFAAVVVLKALPGYGATDGLKDTLSILRTLLPFVILIVLINLFLVGRETPVLLRALFGLKQSLRVVIVILALRLLLSVASPIELSDTFIRVLYPLKRIGLKVEELSLVLMLIFSFVPLITREAERIRTAQAVRSGFREGLGMVRQVVPLLVPLVIGVFRRAEDIECSLRARYFERRSISRESMSLGLGAVDLTAIVLSIAALAAGVYSGI